MSDLLVNQHVQHVCEMVVSLSPPVVSVTHGHPVFSGPANECNMWFSRPVFESQEMTRANQVDLIMSVTCGSLPVFESQGGGDSSVVRAPDS